MTSPCRRLMARIKYWRTGKATIWFDGVEISGDATQLPQENILKRKIGVPVLKRVNRALQWAVRRLSAYNERSR